MQVFRSEFLKVRIFEMLNFHPWVSFAVEYIYFDTLHDVMLCIFCRLQRNVLLELASFQEKLLSTVSFEEGFLIPNISPDFIQNIVLDILIWITFIQMNDKRCVFSTRQVSHQGFFCPQGPISNGI